ncbi:MAG: L,D-transpeptidase, partial [Ferruginibacter sp.]
FLVYNKTPDSVDCKGKDCLLYAEINKQTQQLLLYIEGKLVDTFLVSTGISKYDTPNLNLKPSGPVFAKYTSKKFPGGNYKGLGNMPYAVFLRGGYAIHGTTTGNFAKLGTKASHGCIRLHPTNAKIFSELVKKVGLKDTWVTIKDSIPN